MHELAHGLGSLEIIDEATGESIARLLFDVYALNMLRTEFGRTWDRLTAQQRRQSQLKAGMSSRPART